MNKQEFMARLESLLDGIPEEEKKEALAFYTSYFEDAGVENEESILKELESPEQVAETIRANLGETVKADKSDAAGEAEQEGASYHSAADQGYTGNDTWGPGEMRSGGGADSSRILLIVILAVITSPIWIGVLGGIFGVVCGIFFGTLGVMLGCLIGGAAAFGIGISLCAGGLFAAGIVTMGASMLLIAIGFLALLLFVLICGRFIPWLVRGIVSLVQRLMYNNRKGVHAR